MSVNRKISLNIATAAWCIGQYAGHSIEWNGMEEEF